MHVWMTGRALTALKMASSSAKASMIPRISTSPRSQPSLGSFPEVMSLHAAGQLLERGCIAQNSSVYTNFKVVKH